MSDPNPVKHPAVLIARVRDAIEPSLAAAGFRFDSRNKPPANHGYSLWIDYARSGDTFSIRFDRWTARLAAEILDSQGRIEVVAEVDFDGIRTSNELMGRVGTFVDGINRSLSSLRHIHEKPDSA